jgi:hypothetical protein
MRRENSLPNSLLSLPSVITPDDAADDIVGHAVVLAELERQIDHLSKDNERLLDEVKRAEAVRTQQAAELKRLRQLERSVMYGDPRPLSSDVDAGFASLPLSAEAGMRAKLKQKKLLAQRRAQSGDASVPLLPLHEGEHEEDGLTSPARASARSVVSPRSVEPFNVGEVSQGGARGLDSRVSRTRRHKQNNTTPAEHYSELSDGAAKPPQSACCVIS